jgi:mannosyltransferase
VWTTGGVRTVTAVGAQLKARAGMMSKTYSDDMADSTDRTSTTTESPSVALSSRHADRLYLAALVVIAAWLQFHALSAKSFWFDEGVSVELARLDGYNFLRLLWRREANMSLYYLLLRGWLHFGGSEFFIRSLSVLPALATIPVVYQIGRQLYDRRVGLIAATLLTCNAYEIRYAQEARSYSLYTFLCALSSMLFVANILTPSQRRRTWHILVSALAVYAHFYSGLILAAQLASLRCIEPGRIPPESKKQWQRIGIAIFPAILFAATTGVGPLNWIHRPGAKDLYEYYEHMAGNGGWLLLLLYGLACASAVLPWLGLLGGRNAPWAVWRIQFLLLWLLLPVAATVAVSLVRPMFVARYFVACLPAFVLLAAAGIGRLRPSWVIVPATLLIAVLALKGTASYYNRDFDLDRDDYRTASRYIFDRAQPGDVLIFHIAMGRMPYEFYRSLSPDRSDPSVIYPARGDRLSYRDFLGKPSAQFLESVPAQYPRVWIVLKDNRGPKGADPTTLTIDRVFGNSYGHMEEENFPGVEVRLYSK